jgi:hypothetical protein
MVRRRTLAARAQDADVDLRRAVRHTFNSLTNVGGHAHPPPRPSGDGAAPPPQVTDPQRLQP